MSEKHTPGPWLLEPRDDGAKGFRLYGADGDLIDCLSASRWIDEQDDPEQVANARLIAAAPDLLASVRHLRAFWRPGSNHDTQEVQYALAAADAAIAKAQGQHS